MGRLWLINPDAEQELLQHHLRAGAPYQTPAALATAIHRLEQAFSTLTLDEPLVFCGMVGVSERPLRPGDDTLSCWCPTSLARATAQMAYGVELYGPSMDVLTRCNDKLLVGQFTSAHVEGRTLIHGGDELIAHMTEHRWLSRDDRARSVGAGGAASVRLKCRFGQAGRGQRRVNEFLSADDLRFVQQSARQGGLIVEPELAVVSNHSIHGIVDTTQVITGELCSFRTDRFSAPTEVVIERSAERGRCVVSAQQMAQDVAEELSHLGYRGPFGLDFVWTDERRLVLVDINARFTLGWSVGMQDRRSAALHVLDRLS